MSIIARAKAFSKKAHQNQFRRDGKTPYFNHPNKVAKLVATCKGNKTQITCAYLHDVIEDTKEDKNQMKKHIKKLFGTRILKKLLCLTRAENEDYFEYLEKIKRDKQLVLIKICDIVSNLSDTPTEKQKIKYAKALVFLTK